MARRRPRSQSDKEVDYYHIARMYAQKMQFADIALALEDITGKTLSVSQICQDIKVIRERWAENEISNFNERVSLELAKIDALELEAYESWQRSKGRKIRITKKVSQQQPGMVESVTDEGEIVSEEVEGAIVGVIEKTTTEEELVGDARYLDIIYKCIDRRIKLLGLDAPTKIKVSKEKDEDEEEAIRERKTAILIGILQPANEVSSGSSD